MFPHTQLPVCPPSLLNRHSHQIHRQNLSLSITHLPPTSALTIYQPHPPPTTHIYHLPASSTNCDPHPPPTIHFDHHQLLPRLSSLFHLLPLTSTIFNPYLPITTHNHLQPPTSTVYHQHLPHLPPITTTNHQHPPSTSHIHHP